MDGCIRLLEFICNLWKVSHKWQQTSVKDINIDQSIGAASSLTHSVASAKVSLAKKYWIFPQSRQSDVCDHPDREFNHETPYIGIEKNASGTWTYSDGSPLTYQNWAPGEPVNREASICAMMDQQSGQWRAAECTIPRPYYCEIDGTKFQCPDGWTYYSDLNNMDYCYYVQTFNYKDASNWLLYSRDAAEDLCQKMKAHLVSIHSKNESVFVFNLVRSDLSTFTKPTQSLCANQWAWIGLYGNGVNVNTWSDGSPYDYDIVEEKIPSPYNWGISNDPSCNLNKYYHNDGGYPWARFVCKRPAPQMMKMKMINKH